MRKNFGTPFTGLSQQEAFDRLERYGHNELKSRGPKSILRISISATREPMVLLLMGIGLIYLFLGEAQEFYSLLTFLIMILTITIYQENKTEKTLNALRELSSPRAVVVREGKQMRIPGRDVVPDDIVILNEGDRVPADILLLEGGPLSVDESIMTGESVPAEKISSSEKSRVILSGTMVLKGQALGKVQWTGEQTELGKIGKTLEERKDVGTPLQLATRRIVNKLSIMVGVLTAFVIFYYWATRDHLLDSVLVGLTLAMAILPNELPAVLLIFLAAGAWRISKRNVLTRKVPSIEALGGVTYLCVDKTGTLTQNKMVLKELWNGREALNLDQLDKSLPDDFHEIVEFGILASPRDPFDPMERSIKQAGDRLLTNTEHLHPQWRLSREYQISNELLAVLYAWRGEDSSGFVIGAKGAPEAVLDLCHVSSEPLTKRVEEEMLRMASQGLRVLAVARAFSAFLPEKQHDLNFEFLGLIGFEDPIREDARAAVQECQNAGVSILMITGDHPATAKSIARQINLKNTKIALTGIEIESMDNERLREELKRVQVFCRMRPLDKLRIVSVLQESGEIVAMTGDGVNDAPALRKAQIGISMGKRGTDVAREASSVVLLDDSFSSIVAAIRTGRRIYQNLREAFSYLLMIHVPITLLSVVPVLVRLPLILLPVHIAFLHLIIEPASTTLFEALPEDPESMKSGPRTPGSRLMTKVEIIRSLITGAIVSCAVVGVYYYALKRGLSASEARAITFTTLILLNLLLIFMLSRRRVSKVHLKILIFSSIGLLAMVLYVPFFRELFRFGKLHLHDLALCFLVTALSAAILKTLGNIGRSKNSDQSEQRRRTHSHSC